MATFGKNVRRSGPTDKERYLSEIKRGPTMNSALEGFMRVMPAS